MEGVVLIVGDAYFDFIFAPVERLPSPCDQIVIVPCFACRPAGSLGYLARALSEGLGLPGLKVISNIGDEQDFLSNEWLRTLEAIGVDVSLVRRVSGASIGAGAVFIRPDGERWFVASYGANAHPLFLPEAALENADTLLIAGFCQTPGLWNEHTVASLHHFKSKPGKNIMLDPNWDPDPEAKQNLLKVLPFVDVFLPNRDELRLVADVDDVSSAAKLLVEQFGLTVVAKLDRDGCLVAEASGIRCFPAESVSVVVDTCGAGDFFYAAFVVSYIKTGGNVLASAEFANKFAGTSIQHLALEDKLCAGRALAQRENKYGCETTEADY